MIQLTRLLGLALAASLLPCLAFGQVRINEIRTDQPGTDNDEYFELCGPPGTSLDGLTYIVIGDGAGGSGVIESVTPLTGLSIPADGFFLAVEDTFTLRPLASADLVLSSASNGLNFENSDNVTHMLVSGFMGTLNQDLDTNDDCVLDVTPWTAVIDSIGLVFPGTIPPQDCLYGPTIGPDGSFAPGHISRFVDCFGCWHIRTFGDLMADTPGEPNSSPLSGCDALCGNDLFHTPAGATHDDFGGHPIPGGFFDPGSDPFTGRVDLQGLPLSTNPPGILGPTDTIVERKRTAVFPPTGGSDTVPIEIVALSLTSVNPITVTYGGGGSPELWDVRVNLSSFTPQPPGTMTITTSPCDCTEGGTFTSSLPVLPRLVLCVAPVSSVVTSENTQD